MDFVRGPNLERTLEAGDRTMATDFAFIDPRHPDADDGGLTRAPGIGLIRSGRTPEAFASLAGSSRQGSADRALTGCRRPAPSASLSRHRGRAKADG